MHSSDLPDYLDCFQRSPAAQAILDRDGAIIEINEQASRLLGIGRDALVGRRVAELILRKIGLR